MDEIDGWLRAGGASHTDALTLNRRDNGRPESTLAGLLGRSWFVVFLLR